MDKAIGNTPHENLFQKELYDLSQFPNSLSWSDDGLVSVVARNSVTVYIPNFEYMALYTVKWITIEQCNTIVSTETSSVLDFNEVCQWMNSKREEVVFRSCQWSPRGLSIEQESLLLIVLSEGSILIVERDINRLNNFDVGSFRLSLNGFSIPMDFGKIYSSMFRSKDESKTSIGAVWHSKIIKSPCRNFLVLFAFCETEVSAWLVSYDHCANRLEKTLKVDILAKSSVSACLSVYRTERICSAVSKETEVDKILVYLGCNDGSLLICELSFQINLYDHRTNKNNFGKFTTLCVLRPFQKPISSLFLIDAYLFCVVEQSLDCLDCTSLNTLKSNLTKVFARHKHSIMGVAESKQLDTGMANKLLASPKKTIVTCSCDFEIQSNLIQAQDNSKCTKEAKALSLNEETLNPLDMHFGVAADPSGYLLAFGKRAPGIGGNTRETQLTSSLRYDHLNVVWRACPYLESESMCNWASDSQLIAKIILDICTECEKEYSRASIPLLYWLSLEKCNEFAQNTQLLEAIRSNDELIVKLSTEKLENKRSTENYSDENNTLYHEQEVLKYEESDCSSSDSSIDGKKSSLSKGSKFVDGNAAKLNKKSRREGLDTIDKTSFQVLGDFSQKFFRCQPNELLLQHLNALLSGLNIAVLRLHNSKVVDEVTSDCCMNDILFSLPSDPDKLKKHLSILKTFHLLIFASIRMRMLDCEKALTWAIRIRNFLAFSSCLLSLERVIITWRYAVKSKWGKDFFSVAEIGSILYMYLIVDAFVNDPSYRKGNIDLDRVLATIRDVKAFFKWIRQDGNLILNDDELNCTDIVSSFGIQEYCISCSQEIVFDTANPYKATCDACDISIERCVHTFRLVINVQRKVPDLIELDANTLSEEIYFCPSCHCSIGMTNLRLIEKYHSVKSYKVQLSKHYSGNKTACFEGVDSSAQFAGLFLCASSFCPYCLISMRHL